MQESSEEVRAEGVGGPGSGQTTISGAEATPPETVWLWEVRQGLVTSGW